MPRPSLQMMAAAVVDDLVHSRHQEGSPETRRPLAAEEGLQQAEEHAEAHLRAAAGTAAVVCQSDQEEAAAQEAGAGEAGEAPVPAHSWLHVEPVGRGQPGRDSGGAAGSRLLCNSVALQLWLLRCCQGERGGFKDKPGKPPDYYHTCYCLSGLSAMQHMGGRLLGPKSNLLARADPLCNVVKAQLDAALVYNPNCKSLV